MLNFVIFLQTFVRDSIRKKSLKMLKG